MTSTGDDNTPDSAGSADARDASTDPGSSAGWASEGGASVGDVPSSGYPGAPGGPGYVPPIAQPGYGPPPTSPYGTGYPVPPGSPYGSGYPPPPVQPGMGQPAVPYSAGGGMYPPVRETNSKALISLIAGIGSFAVCPGILGVVAVILGNAATEEIRASAGLQEGESLAKAGVILGWISIALVAVFLVGMLILFVLGMVAQN